VVDNVVPVYTDVHVHKNIDDMKERDFIWL
jgi:hypothetical protein